MENKEIKRTTLPETHDCNVCKKCQESIRDGWNKCSACQLIFFEKLYKNISSGNKEVDEIIKNPIYIPHNRYNNDELKYYEWILWEHLSNINEIARGGFGIINKATLVDGRIDTWSIRCNDEMKYKRRGTREVAIKIIKTNSDIAEGLKQIHSFGMVHRDLHSGNILKFSNERINIGDLGLCQPVKNEATTTTEEKYIYGVIPYIPPEVLRGEKFTKAGDIYSFAMLLWELATGKPPFYDFKHDHILIMAILDGARPKITFPLIPPCIAEIIITCWDVNPENRPTAREVWSKLLTLLGMYERFRDKNSTDEELGPQFLESEKYLKEMAESDDSTTTDQSNTTMTTTTTRIHSGAVYTSRVLTLQMIDFSKDLIAIRDLHRKKV
ncbi:hypothetical protein G9A89_008433 [Geosiphon pyriformis]|nr:hypothetical protein G9A89_008433 [Geosiphon pyriformis]